MVAGWTCYDPINGPVSVPFPDENALVFDVEVCVPSGQNPVMACAVGIKYWYSWTSPVLLKAKPSENIVIDELIPLESTLQDTAFNLPNKFKTEKIIVGHNVSYDRARVKEQVWIENTKLRFLDTMSMHVCVSGITSYQRTMLKSNTEFGEEDLNWSNQSSLNNLVDVYKLYCQKELKKERRNIFVEGNLRDIKNDFQNLMSYCANDVVVTNELLKVLFPLFMERFKHPVTFAGILELGMAYLPINSNWTRYINESNLTYKDLDIESNCLLSRRADHACQLFHKEKYKRDLWMHDQDWSTQDLKLMKGTNKKTTAIEKTLPEKNDDLKAGEFETLAKKFKFLMDTKSLLPVRPPLLPGYPAWYRKLCEKPYSENWTPGANSIGTAMQVTPKLLALCWEGYPLKFLKDHGWGFLIPNKSKRENGETGDIPLEELVEKCPVLGSNIEATANESAEAMNNLWKEVEMNLGKRDYYSRAKKKKTSEIYNGTGVWCDIVLENCCWFLKLPHKNGPSFRVGNPLAKDFLNKFSENVLSGEGHIAERIIEIAKMLSYWRNNRDRIMGQIAIWLPENLLPENMKSSEMRFGAIIPQVKLL